MDNFPITSTILDLCKGVWEISSQDPLQISNLCNALWDTQESAMHQSKMEDKVAHYISKAEGGLSCEDENDENEK